MGGHGGRSKYSGFMGSAGGAAGFGGGASGGGGSAAGGGGVGSGGGAATGSGGGAGAGGGGPAQAANGTGAGGSLGGGGQIKSLAGYEAYERDWIEDHFDALSDAEIQYLQNQLKDVFDNAGFYMNIDSQYLENCCDEHFKNQFEVGGMSGGASYDASDLTPRNPRIQAAIDLFGLDYRSMSASDYEKYGSMNSGSLMEVVQNGTAFCYGDSLVKFKKENVWDRTTYTYDDSLAIAGMSCIGGKVSTYSIAGLPAYDSYGVSAMLQKVHSAEPFKDKPYEWMSRIESWTSYLEVQYHGDLTMRDVESITFTSSIPNASVLSKIHSFGVKTYTYKGGVLSEI